MKKLLTIVLSFVLTMSLFIGTCLAVQKGDCLMTKQQLKDGSCQTAGDCLKIKKQVKDGSCQVAGDCLKIKKQLKDGSCVA